MDTSGQLTFDDNPLSSKFNEGLSYIQQGNLQQTLDIMEEIFSTNPNFTGVIETIKSIKFWQNRWPKSFQLPQGQDRANYLLNEWSNYTQYTINSHIDYEKIIIYLKNYIFKNIIKNLIYSYQQSDVPNIDILLQIGEIFLCIEEYDKSIEAFEYARLFKKKDSHLLTLLGEAYYQNKVFDKSKALFREAFLHDPQKVPIHLINVEFISQIIEHIKKIKNYNEKQIREWIPIYGVLLNIFNVKREITAEELSRLNMEIQELENEYNNKKIRDEILLAKIINRYFWLIDYYTLQNKNNDYINIYQNKLKEIDHDIYQKYVHLQDANSNDKVN